MKCKKCGENLPSGSKFCTKCGTPVKKTNFKTVGIIAAIAALVVVCCVVAVALLPKGKKKQAASTSTEGQNMYNRYPVEITWKESGKKDHPMDFETDSAKSAVYWAMEQTYGEDKVDRDKEIMLSDCYELRAISMSSKTSQADIDKICELENLHYLEFQFTELTDTSALGNLKYLEHLDLYGCELTDISCLQNLDNVISLDLSHTNVEDYSPLLDMDGLKVLDLDFMGNPIDTDVMEQMNYITYLSLDGNGLEDIEFLRGYSGIKDLSINENNVSDLSPLEDKALLEQIEFDMNNVSDITPLKNKPEMFLCSFNYNHVTDITPLEGYELVRLNAAYNGVQDISVVGGMTKINEIDLSGNDLTDISALGNFNQPHHIILNHNHISDIKPLLAYPNMGELELAFNDLRGDLTMFGKELEHLAVLDIAGNNITSFDGLENLPKLSEIRFDDPNLDIELLLDCDSLYWIYYSADTPEDVKEKLRESGKNCSYYSPAGDSFEVVLEDAGPNTVLVIKTVREITELGLAESKDLVDEVPSTIIEVDDYEEALDIQAMLQEQGATALVSIYH